MDIRRHINMELSKACNRNINGLFHIAVNRSCYNEFFRGILYITIFIIYLQCNSYTISIYCRYNYIITQIRHCIATKNRKCPYSETCLNMDIQQALN